MKPESQCEREGREHLMFSALSADQCNVITLDWCVRCGVYDLSTKPHLVIKGRRRGVEDVRPPEGLL